MLGFKDERDRAFKDKYPRVKLVCMRLTMPVWFDFAFANLIAFLPQAGFKFGPIHRLVLPLELADATVPPDVPIRNNTHRFGHVITRFALRSAGSALCYDVPRHIFERFVRVAGPLARHLQHAFADDVALDLVGAAGD